ncbi:MAG TPA: hypothetical protein VNV63_03530 [Nitrospiria bacterium]|jgi:hypothetical protein|nr:hypothetical protein [Nitrospiria bacterium]
MRNFAWSLTLFAMGLSLIAAAPGSEEAPPAFDNATNGFVDAATYGGESSLERKKFLALTDRQKRQLATFLRSL